MAASATSSSKNSSEIVVPELSKWDAHQADLERRRVERDKKKKVLNDCLDPSKAAEYEHSKRKQSYKVCASFNGLVDGKVKMIHEERTVRAQSEQDAWAMFCDEIRRYPSPKQCEIAITKAASDA